MEVEGINAIVTGAAGGIGRATVQALIAHGAAKVGLIVHKKKQLNTLVDELGDRYGFNRFIGILADVHNQKKLKTGYEKFCAEAGSLDLLVNNAGILLDGAIYAVSFKGVSKYPFESWKETLETNLGGVFINTQLAVEKMIKKKRGVIVNISSVSRLGRAGQSAYSASKGGIVSLTFTLAQELAPYNIRCCAIAPGLIDTPMAARIPEAYRKEMISHMAVGRMGKPEEVAHGIIFCVENDFFNGRVLELDGGTFG